MTNTAEHPSTPTESGSTGTNLAAFLLARYAERLDVVEHVIDTLSRLPRQPGAISLNGVDVYDPRHELADIEAKRQIAGLHSGDHECEGERLDWHTDGVRYFYCLTLRALAGPYADHPDYREEWKP